MSYLRERGKAAVVFALMLIALIFITGLVVTAQTPTTEETPTPTPTPTPRPTPKPTPTPTPVPIPDLTVTSASAPASARAGDSIELSFTTKNAGKASAGPFKVKFYLSTSAKGTEIYLGSCSFSSLNPGSSSSKSITASIPASVTPRKYYVTAYADADKQISESNENNNMGSTSPRVIEITPPLSELAKAKIKEAELKISNAESQGINVSWAKTVLVESQNAFDKGDYNKALGLAEDAKDIAIKVAQQARDKAIKERKKQRFIEDFSTIVIAIVGIYIVISFLMIFRKK